MARLKIGDKVVPLNVNGCSATNRNFDYLIITALDFGGIGSLRYDVIRNGMKIDNCWSCYQECSVRLFKEDKLTNNKTIMSNLIEKARLLVKGEPEKSLIKKGITNIDDTLTVDGKQLFEDFLYRSNKTVFVADPAIAALLAEKDEQ